MSQGKVKDNGPQDIHQLMSDAGIYSYASLCAILLHELFDNEWDEKFCRKTIKRLLRHLRLPKQVDNVMLTLVQGEGSQTHESYVKLLLSETTLGKNSVLIVQDLIFLAVKDGCYDARMRVLILRMAELLGIASEIVDFYEDTCIEMLTAEPEQTPEQLEAGIKRERRKKVKRWALIGVATVGGGVLLGLTGGLVAPLIGAGVGTILGGTAGVALTSVAGVAVIGSLFGVAGAGLTGYKMKKRVGEVEEFGFEYLNENKESRQQLHLTIAISGWLYDDLEDNFTRPWKNARLSREQYYLRYESKYLLELGEAMQIIVNMALSMAAQQMLKFTVLQGLLAALAWPTNLLAVAKVIDNPWGVSCRRSSEVGKVLADVLLTREHGRRPVTLVGFSLGARVIYYCLREMAERGDCEGIVQDVVMLGAPVTGDPDDWSKLMRVPAGRVINGYCESDWLLKFLYRKLSLTSDVAGLQAVELEHKRLCNADLTSILDGHSEYSEKLEDILQHIGIKTCGKEVDFIDA